MKVMPLAAGTGVPSASDVGSPTRSVSPDRIERAKAVAAGQVVESTTVSSDPQVSRAQEAIKKIKMRTQASVYRDLPPEPVEEGVELAPSTTPDVVEQAQGTEETKPLSPQFAALAKAKRALQVKERELAQREQAFKSQAPAGSEDIIAKLKANPLGVLQEAGVTYDQLTEAILSSQSGTAPEINALKSELKALKEELNTQFTTRDQQAEQQVLGEIKKEIVNLVNSDPDKYEAIREAKATDTVKDLIHRTWQKTGEVLDTAEAAELVENQLIDEALPFARIKKVQSRLTPAQEKFVEKIFEQAPKANTKIMRTLTNRDNASPIMDKKARAMAAFNGTLKKG